MDKVKCFLILLSICLPAMLDAKQYFIEDIFLTKEAYISEIKKQYPENPIDVFSTGLGRFAAVYVDSTWHFVVSTADYSSIKGYKGYSNLLVYIDWDGNVEKITFIESQDTKPYVKKVLRSNILSELSKQHIDTQKRPSYLVTGATITSTVFNKSITQTLEAFGKIFPQLEFGQAEIIVPDSLTSQRAEEAGDSAFFFNEREKNTHKQNKNVKNTEGGQIE